MVFNPLGEPTFQFIGLSELSSLGFSVVFYLSSEVSAIRKVVVNEHSSDIFWIIRSYFAC